MENEHMHQLQQPLPVAGGKVTELKLRQPTAVQMARAQKSINLTSNEEAMYLFTRDLVAGAAGIAPEALNDLPEPDLNACADIILEMITGGADDRRDEASDEPIQIENPIEVSGIQYDHISIRAPTTGERLKSKSHLRQNSGPQSKTMAQMSLVSSVSGLPMQVVHQLPYATMLQAVFAIEVFSAPGQKTGSTSPTI